MHSDYDYFEYDEISIKIDRMLEASPKFDFAKDILEGINKWINENEHVTDKQREAVYNIKHNVNRKKKRTELRDFI